MKSAQTNWKHNNTDLQLPTVSFCSVFKQNYLVHRQTCSVFSEKKFFTIFSVKDNDFLLKGEKKKFTGKFVPQMLSRNPCITGSKTHKKFLKQSPKGSLPQSQPSPS